MDQIRLLPNPGGIMPGQLPDLSEIPPLNDTDRECFEELRHVLKRHGKLDRFGVNLLHSHFPVGDDEVLVETFDPENRVLVSRPEPVDQAPDGFVAIETSWQFTADGETMSTFICKNMCFVQNRTRKHKREHMREYGH